jgi:asparagine synthase (glutamine-hydrolysing)
MTTGDFNTRAAFLGVSYAEASKAAGSGSGSLKRIRAVAQEFLRCEPVWTDAKVTDLWVSAQLRRNARPHRTGITTVYLSDPPRDAPAPEDFSSLVGDVPAHGSPEVARDVANILGRMLPTFALVQFNMHESPVVAATDYLGFYHLYWYQGDGWSAMSNSALALAQCGDVKLDEDALANQSLLGGHLAESTPFRGIYKLGPGGFCVLNAGQAHVGMYADPMSLREASDGRSLQHLARDIADQLRATTTRYVESHPELVLQLSGGLDSRVELAAIPPKLRDGLSAITIDNGTRDAAIAAELASATGLLHRVIPLKSISVSDPASAWQRVRQEAIRHDCSGDPLDSAMIEWVEDRLGSEPRIHGAGGEIIRGYYYPGQRQRDTIGPSSVSRLANWRLFSNEVVQTECLGTARAQWARDVTVSRLQGIFREYDCDWLTATDMFYAFHRMSRTGGLHLSVVGTERILLSPLLAREFIHAALSSPPGYKRWSRLFTAILTELDPGLASVPLDSGYVPIHVAKGNASGRLRSLPVTAGKVVRKIKQQAVRSSRSSSEGERIAHLVLSHWRATPNMFDIVSSTGAVDTEWLEQVLAGHRTPDTATIGYLANLQVMSEQINRKY